MTYTIKKDGRYVRDFTEGKKFTSDYRMAEKYRSKKAAVIAAREYGRNNGGGYIVHEF